MAWMVHDYPEPPPETDTACPVCPVCGAECDTFHIDRDRDIVGCENCMSAVDAWDWVNV